MPPPYRRSSTRCSAPCATCRSVPLALALLTFAAVSDLAEPKSGEYVSLALLLALMAGGLQLVMGVLGMEFVANFMPRPVLIGFVYASAVVIALSQAQHLLGIPVSLTHSTVGTALELGERIGETNPLTLALGMGSLAALVLLAKVAPSVPAPLVVAAAAMTVYLFDLEQKGVDVVGEIPQGLPGFSVPVADPEQVRVLLPAAVTVAFVGFVESISVAKAIAAKEKYEIDSNRELSALGLANISAAFPPPFSRDSRWHGLFLGRP